MTTISGWRQLRMSSVMRKREKVMTVEQYCEAMRKTNLEQRDLILEAIHRMHRQYADSDLHGAGGMWKDVHHEAVDGDF